MYTRVKLFCPAIQYDFLIARVEGMCSRELEMNETPYTMKYILSR